MQNAATQGAFLLQQYDRLLAGLGDAHRGLAARPGGKTAGWLLGHLVITGDFARRLCGEPPLAPKEWRAQFAPGTAPSPDPAAYPPMAELVATFRAVYADLVRRAGALPSEVAGAENPFEPTRGAFPTAGDFVAYLASGHLAYHLGQLSGWREAAGMPPQ